MNRYRIGEFSSLSGVSTKTLRFYDEIGLLRPSSVDARTGYRHYTHEQFELLASIQELKTLGVPLAEIRSLMGRAVCASDRQELLERVQGDLRRSIDSANRSLRWIESELEELRGCRSSIPVVVKQRKPLRIASVRGRLKHYDDIQPVEQALLADLPSHSVGKMRGVLWHRCADSGVLEAEAFVELKHSVPQRDCYRLRELEPATAACAYVRFNADAEPAYDAIRRWMHARGFRLAGAKREIYLGPLLEIQFPMAAA
jgi:DNA-binding transcriptional MerR regulator